MTGNLINQLVVGKAEEVLLNFDDDSIDFILTSPPYDNLRTYKGYHFPFDLIAEQLVS